MEKVCGILMRSSCGKLTLGRNFRLFSLQHNAQNVGNLPRRGSPCDRNCNLCWRHFGTTWRPLTAVIEDKSQSESKNAETNVDDDFYGFEGLGPDVVEVEIDQAIDPLVKYGGMFTREPKSDEDKVFFASYGAVRFDNDNRPISNCDADLDSDGEQETGSEVQRAAVGSSDDLNDLFDRQYFAEIAKSSDLAPDEVKTPNNYIEEQYFNESFSETNGNRSRSYLRRATNVGLTVAGYQSSAGGFEPVVDHDNGATNMAGNDIRGQAKRGGQMSENGAAEVKTMTAYDYVIKMRAERTVSGTDIQNNGGNEPKFETYTGTASNKAAIPFVKLDSKGFRIYGDEVKDLEKEPEMNVVHLLKHCVLYNENDIVAISKPYGLQCHDGPGHHHSLTKYLPELAKHVCKGVSGAKLYTVHRLDIETTGVLLLAKTQEMARRLHKMLFEGKIVKTYWALTRDVPEPSEGIVDIPMAEGSVNGKARMVLRPEATDEAKLLVPKYSGKTYRAMTSYRVVNSNGNAALVELKPTTGVKHQVRVHLAFALGCPILGDHKYSHLSKLAPQRLTSDMLQRLNVRQSKVRYIPMHLHSRGVAIPDVIEGRNITIGARLPKHFVRNLDRLQIKIK